jgi:hypothetical protein
MIARFLTPERMPSIEASGSMARIPGPANRLHHRHGPERDRQALAQQHLRSVMSGLGMILLGAMATSATQARESSCGISSTSLRHWWADCAGGRALRGTAR